MAGSSALHSLIILLFSFAVSASNDTLLFHGTAGFLPHDSTVLASRDIPADYPLRVLCIGDSITVGIGDEGSSSSTDALMDGKHNGYRLDLYNLLQRDGLSPQFVGAQVSGTDNPQPDMEAVGGYLIDDILNLLQNDDPWPSQPNLILIHAGTNDMGFGSDGTENPDNPERDWQNAPERLGKLLDYVLCNAPNAVVIVAMLIQSTVVSYSQARTDIFNKQVPSIVGERYMAGYKITTVDMSFIGDGLEVGNLHPTANGYTYMAAAWHSAIQNIPSDWWSTNSNAGSGSAGTISTCDRNSISFSPAIGGNQLNGGFHVSGDNPEPATSSQPSSGSTFSPGWGDSEVIALGCGYDGNGVLFADLNGDGRNDYMWVNYTIGSEGATDAWLNGGHDVWNAVNDGNPIHWGNPGAMNVEMVDLDGDKKAEFILVSNDQFVIYENGGPNGNVWLWNQLPNAANELNYIFGGAIPYHYFADITGDGRADLIVFNSNSVLDLYINDGSDDNGGFTWTQCKAIGYEVDIPIFVDIDGDGRADYVAKDSDGGLRGWINSYSGGCNLKWIPINGATPKSLALGAGAPQNQVRLADFTGDGKADYLVVSPNGQVTIWPNIGSTHPPDDPGIGGFGAAVRLSDIDGDGVDDYVSVTDYSGIAAQLNKGQGSGNSWNWNTVGDGNVIALGYPDATRHEVHLADMNADGRDDYLIVNETTGEIDCYLNLGAGTQHWQWDVLGDIAIGVGGVGAGVRVADFDGDGKADYIYLDESGAASVWLNAGPPSQQRKWTPVNGGAVAALGIGANRDDVQFADIDGDGKADYCFIHPDTGALEVWYNLYSGGTVGWSPGGQIIAGQGYPGRNIRLARIGTSGRHDYVAIDEDTGAIKAWTNDCGKVVGTAARAIAGQCGVAPLPTQTTSQPGPPFTPRATNPSATITAPPSPCTATDQNGGMIVYATSTSGTCAGASRVVFNGKRLSVKVESLRSVEVNSHTGSVLFNDISSSLDAACPTPTPGQTVTACDTPAPITSLPAENPIGGCTNHAKLSIIPSYVRYSDPQVRLAMINMIAAVVNATSLDPKNTDQHTVPDGKLSCSFKRTTIPSLIEAIYTEQTFETNGNIVLQNLEIQFSFDTPSGGNYECTAAGLGNDGVGLAASSEALDKLGIGAVSSLFGASLGLTCLVIDATSEDSESGSNSGPGFGGLIPSAEPSLPLPTFPAYPYTYTNKNGGTTAYKASVAAPSSGYYYPTNQPSMVIAVGTTVKAEIEATSKVDVGTLRGDALSATISSILDAACPSVTSQTVTACAPPAAITSVWYVATDNNVDNQNPAFGNSADVDVSIRLCQYSTNDGRKALIEGISHIYGNSAMNNTGQSKHCGNCDPQHTDLQFSNVGSGAQMFFVKQDDSTNGIEQVEFMQTSLSFKYEGDSDLALACDSSGLAFGLISVLSLFVPWLSVLDFEGPALDAICAGLTSTGD